MKELAAAALLAACALGAAAETVGQRAILDMTCKDAGDEVIARLSAQLKEADLKIPNVPPEEIAYLKKERTAILNQFRSQGSKNPSEALEKRHSALQARPMYRVLELRDSLISAQSQVDTILGGGYSYKKPDANKLARSISTVSAVSGYVLRVGEAASQTYAPTGMTFRQVVELHADAIMMPLELQKYMECKFATLMYLQ